MEDTLDIYTIYHPTEEAPGMYIVKKWIVGNGGSQTLDPKFLATSKDLEALRDMLMIEMRLFPMGRQSNDDPQIVESYL